MTEPGRPVVGSVDRDGRSTLLSRFRSIVETRPGHAAVRSGAVETTYAELAALAGAIRGSLAGSTDGGGSIGLLLNRSTEAYASMWTAIACGRPYVPLNPGYPLSRLDEIVRQAGVSEIVCSGANADAAGGLGVTAPRLVNVDDLRPSTVDVESLWEAVGDGVTGDSGVAYILFTSGSTGRPKGVPISYDNLAAFVANLTHLIPYRPDDVCSQVCELSFDFSVHEIYLALLSGCTLCPARAVDLFDPSGYAARNGLTVWISVPSLARVALENGIPVDGRLDTLRVSIFNGEALTGSLAEAWRGAAPNTVIWNNYGPTECTVAVTAQHWTGAGDGADDLTESDVVSIGTPFPGCETALLDGPVPVSTRQAPDGTTGELLLAGPQRFAGYLDPGLPTPFVAAGGTTWYRTGDRVRWRDGRLYHLGRLDHQVKVGGHRIELQEVEHRLRTTLDRESLAVVAHPSIRPRELVLFLAGAEHDAEHHAEHNAEHNAEGEQAHVSAILTTEATGLPAYMLPARIITLDALPTNTNGKLDRSRLQALADEPPHS